MPYQLCQGVIVIGEYETEAEALAALRSHCDVEGVPVGEVVRAMSMDLWEIDLRGRRHRRWWGDRLVAKVGDT
jgi:hypothetical protein